MNMPDGHDKSNRDPVASISFGIVITGDVECTTELLIAGRVQGNVRCSTVVVDEGGAVTGGIYANRIRVSGAVEGTIESGDLAVEAGGRIAGTITYSRLKVSAGGIVEGNFTHRDGEASTAENSNLKLVEAGRANPRRVYFE
jgi:cytoskeletal protein CcmA (bactofilin family)